MQINFKSCFASLLGERLLHRLKTRVLLLWNASWHDTRLCLLSLGWQLRGRLWALQGPDLEEFCGAARKLRGCEISSLLPCTPFSVSSFFLTVRKSCSNSCRVASDPFQRSVEIHVLHRTNGRWHYASIPWKLQKYFRAAAERREPKVGRPSCGFHTGGVQPLAEPQRRWWGPPWSAEIAHQEPCCKTPRDNETSGSSSVFCI